MHTLRHAVELLCLYNWHTTHKPGPYMGQSYFIDGQFETSLFTAIRINAQLIHFTHAVSNRCKEQYAQ